jgi:hypothetical protein
MRQRISILLLLAAWPILAHAAPFQNLGFDQARTNTLSPDPGPILRGIGPTEDLLPNWELTRGGIPQPTMGLNLDLLSFGYATLISADQSGFFRFPVDGAYALRLVGTPGNQEPFALSQRGDFPADALFLSYRYSGFEFALTLNGTPIRPVIETSTLQAFDISQFAGQTVDLQLTAQGPLMPNQAGISYIDSIAFVIPEPSTLALAILGSLGLFAAHRRRLLRF